MSDTSEAAQLHESHVLQYLSGDFWQGMWGLMSTWDSASRSWSRLPAMTTSWGETKLEVRQNKPLEGFFSRNWNTLCNVYTYIYIYVYVYIHVCNTLKCLMPVMAPGTSNAIKLVVTRHTPRAVATPGGDSPRSPEHRDGLLSPFQCADASVLPSHAKGEAKESTMKLHNL